jgi:hypothetical protein
MQFRNEARLALARAKALLAQGDDHAVRYAALELRLTLEAGIYDRLHDYRREAPQALYETWQPPKVLRYLLEIDPHADQPSTVRFTRQGQDAESPSASLTFSQTPIDQTTLKRNYDALGSFLHMPTLKQIAKSGGTDFSALRRRCEALVAVLDPIVTPPKSSFIGGRFSLCDCTRCGAQMRKRIPPGLTGELAAVCMACEAPYSVLIADGADDQWATVKHAAPCYHCGQVHGAFSDDLKEGYRLTCDGCGGQSVYDCAIFPFEPEGAPTDPDPDGEATF